MLNHKTNTMKKFNHFALIIALVFISNTTYSQEIDKNILQGMHSISSHELLKTVEELASEKYGGRLGGSPEYDLSANWLAAQFAKYDVKPLGDDDTFLQWYDIPYTTISEGCELSLHIPIKEGELIKNYNYVSEFIPGATSGSGEVTAEVIYAGYGITASELSYDDYANIDVRGKIVLIEREIPMSPKDDQDLFIQWAPYSFHQYKLKNAVDHGAIGMIYNYGPITNPNNSYFENIIYTHVGDAVVADVFEGYTSTHADVIKEIKQTLKPHSFETGKTMTIKNITQHYPEGRSSNIVAWIEGSDPELKDEYILVGAHLDHVGRCWETMPGANDNASGVAAILDIARAFKEYDITLKRSIVFIAFGSEEQGIIGSKHYLENPIVPLQKTIGLINLDGVGSGDKIYVTAGKNFPELFDPMKEANDAFIHRTLNANEFVNISRPRLDFHKSQSLKWGSLQS